MSILPRHALTLRGMPASWRPAGGVHATLRQTLWSNAETKEAARAVRIGLDELTDFVCISAPRMRWLAENAVECFLNISYAAGNMPALQRRATGRAREALETLLASYLDRDPASVTSDELQYLVTLTVYSHAIYPTGVGPTEKMVALTNSAYEACRSLDCAMGGDYRKILSSPKVSRDELFALMMWSISIIDAQLVPGLRIPARARALVPTLWQFLGSYPLVGAIGLSEGAHDDTFYDTAYFATHIGYIPTGYGRHALAIKEAPWLYRFLRENFYSVLDMGELDLVAEFVELFRFMGCTPENDLQVRDGTRYLLRLFHVAGDSWIEHREPDETSRSNSYDKMHKPWTGIAGIRARAPEPVRAGTYGSVFRKSVARSAHRKDRSAF